MKSFKQFIISEGISSDTHSIIDGLNRSKNALMNGQKYIYAKMINKENLTPLTTEEAAAHDEIAKNARENGDYFTGSTFGDGTNRYSVQHAIDHSLTLPVVKIPTSGFVKDQTDKYWQGNIERARNAIPSKKNPILIMNN